jgi:hypothetical protein
MERMFGHWAAVKFEAISYSNVIIGRKDYKKDTISGRRGFPGDARLRMFIPAIRGPTEQWQNQEQERRTEKGGG